MLASTVLAGKGSDSVAKVVLGLAKIASSVTNPLGLLALLVFFVVLAYALYLRYSAQQVEKLPEDQRLRFLDQRLTRYGLSADNLTREQKVALLQQELDRRFRITRLVILTTAVVLLLALIIAVLPSVLQAVVVPPGPGPDPPITLYLEPPTGGPNPDQTLMTLQFTLSSPPPQGARLQAEFANSQDFGNLEPEELSDWQGGKITLAPEEGHGWVRLKLLDAQGKVIATSNSRQYRL